MSDAGERLASSNNWVSSVWAFNTAPHSFLCMAKILLVEDEPDFSMLIGEWLKSQHYVVEVVDTGEDAMDRLRFYKYDVVVLDWMLPGITGLEVCKQFRDSGGTTPILLLTGQEARRRKGTRTGCRRRRLSDEAF